MFGRSLLATRNILQNQLRSHSHGGVPGENLPFQINNRFRLTAWFCVFFGSGLGLPFLVVRHQLKKQ